MLAGSRKAAAFLQAPLRTRSNGIVSAARTAAWRPTIALTTTTRGATQGQRQDFSALTVVELKGLLRQRGAFVSGPKADLVQRLSLLDTVGSYSTSASTARTVKSSEFSTINKTNIQARRSRARAQQVSSAVLRVHVPKLTAPKLSQIATRSHSTAAAIVDPTDSDSDSATTDSPVVSSFQDLQGIPPQLLSRLSQMGIDQPTPIQVHAIPHALQGKDVMGLAQTGTGKTLAFGVPLVAQMMASRAVAGTKRSNGGSSIRGLVLAPTRELANQISAEIDRLSHKTPIRTFVVVGGQNIKAQMTRLSKGVDILVATPGRLIDLVDRKALSLHDTHFLVLDEADQMTDMGFLPSLRKIVKMLPPKKERQTMLFSATMSKEMSEVASSYLNPNPVRVEVARAGQTADNVTQELHYVARADKQNKLLELLAHQLHPSLACREPQRAIVFGRTKRGMEKLSKHLNAKGFQAVSIHGNKSQNQRDSAIASFKSGKSTILVATDVAARGLDIPDVKYVYNYELPNVPEAYVHRIGRTARAGKEGAAVSFCSMEEMEDLIEIQKVTGVEISVVSGSPWSRQQAAEAKQAIKDRKKEQAEQQRLGKARRQAIDKDQKSSGKRRSSFR